MSQFKFIPRRFFKAGDSITKDNVKNYVFVDAHGFNGITAIDPETSLRVELTLPIYFSEGFEQGMVVEGYEGL